MLSYSKKRPQYDDKVYCLSWIPSFAVKDANSASKMRDGSMIMSKAASHAKVKSSSHLVTNLSLMLLTIIL